ncbi:MAG: hypothetical protein ABJ013_10330 [Halioglobus sp.]
MSFKLLSPVILLALLGACGGGGSGGSVGYSSEQDPEARAQAIGTSDNTTGTVVVRSGSEVVLTAKDSEGYDDPLLSFEWRQTDNSGHLATLVERTAVSRVLYVPQVSNATTLQFELTVTDSDGKTSSDTVSLRVLPVVDADLFLRLKVDSLAHYQYQLAVVAEPGSEGLGEFQLRIETVARWPDRLGQMQELTLNEETIKGQWPGDFTTEGDRAVFSPKVIRTLPSLNIDDINRHYEAEGTRNLRLEAHRTGDAHLYLRFTLQSFDHNTRVAYINSKGGLNEVINSVEGRLESNLLAVEELREIAGMESRSSAEKYYALIQAPETLEEWLELTGFPKNLNQNSEVVRAVYLNNYDLGFGRDMHMRVDERCGNVYSFVNNYPTLENAIQGRGRFATVVMEYAPLDRSCNGKKIVKFLAYVPDETSGNNVLMRTMNFDGRGEKAVPGVCVSCHRGAVGDLSSVTLADIPSLATSQATALADLDSTFIPWDLDSLLYVESDPAMTGNYDRVSAQDRERYSREAQVAAFRALNSGALSTYQARPERYAASIKLIHGWYGAYEDNSFCQGEDAGALLVNTELMPANISEVPDGQFNGSYTPCGWRGEETVYHGAVARNCRLCHNQTHLLGKNFDTAAEFFDNEKLERYVFDEGSMPLARVTFDRFWLDFHGADSGASILAKRLGVPAQKAPGKPIARIDVQYVNPTSGVVLEGPAPGIRAILLGDNSRYSHSYRWQIDSNCGDAPSLSGDTSVAAGFTLGDSGCAYDVSLETSDDAGSDQLRTRILVP